MRVTTQMINASAAQAGLNIHTASLANYIQTSDSDDSIATLLESKLNTGSNTSSSYKKLAKSATALETAATALSSDSTDSILAKAESKAHDVPVEQVHFHEVGAVDSIVDIVSVAVCLDNLDITDVVVPVLYEGCGTVRCQHGILPIPVPAVANVISENHLCIKVTAVEGELVTPTGAAIVAAIRTKDKLPEEFEIKKIGIGAGKRQYECPGILRAMIIS